MMVQSWLVHTCKGQPLLFSEFSHCSMHLIALCKNVVQFAVHHAVLYSLTQPTDCEHQACAEFQQQNVLFKSISIRSNQ